MDALLKTPLYSLYKDSGAKIVDFARWALPIQFEGILQEHHMVREAAGLFDVSHMGEIEVKGKDALPYLNYIMTNGISRLKINQVLYTVMVNEQGGTLDDVMIYHFNNNHYWIIANASNRIKDFNWMLKHADGFEVEINDISDNAAQLALQGPNAAKILKAAAGEESEQIRFFRFKESVDVNGTSCLISRTGYTGEDGFELYCKPEDAASLWEYLLEVGKKYGLKPAGLGCRDTLRFEACLHLYGNELSEDISPLEAGLGWLVKFDKDEFIGKPALEEQAKPGPKRKLIGFELLGKGIPRGDYKVQKDGNAIGYVTTGYMAPTLKKSLGLALVDSTCSEIGENIDVMIRGKAVKAVIIETPFYSKNYKK